MLTAPTVWENTGFATVNPFGVLIVLGFMFQALPSAATSRSTAGTGTHGARSRESNADAQGDGWSRYNFRGYERGQYYTEYHQVVTTMQAIGDDPGRLRPRALEEQRRQRPVRHDDGADAAAALDQRLHRIDGGLRGVGNDAATSCRRGVSKQSSNPVRELRYVDNDADVGTRHLRDLGVRYVMLRTPEAKAVTRSPDLLITTSAPWDIYQVSGSDIVVPLEVQPVVVRNGRTFASATSGSARAVPASGRGRDARRRQPGLVQRVSVQVDLSCREGEPGEPGRRVDIVTPVEQIEPVALAPIAVSGVEIRDQSLEFDVDRTGVPVLVRRLLPELEHVRRRRPYIGPNMMVVVPTAEHVELSYGRSGVDYLTLLLTLVGIGLCFRGAARATWCMPPTSPCRSPAAISTTTATSTSMTRCRRGCRRW